MSEIAVGWPDDKHKPPLGVMPKEIYERRRIQELLRALVDFAWEGQMFNLDLMILWSKELTGRLEGLRGTEKEADS